MDAPSRAGARPGVLTGSPGPRKRTPTRAAAPSGADRPRHPNCPLGPSLVVSTIAFSRWLQPADSGVGNLRGMARLNFGLLVCTLAVLVAGCQQQIKSPTPNVRSLAPPDISAGQPAFTLEVDGNNFTPASIVLWNGSPRNTLFVTTKE